MPDWLSWKARGALNARREMERNLAWAAHVEVATRTPFLQKLALGDRDYYVAEALFDSGPIIESLDALLYAVVDPNQPFVLPLVEAAREVRMLAEMRPAWIERCDRRAGGPADPASDTSLRYVDGPAMRDWSRAAEAKAAVETAQQALHRLHPALTEFYGFDITNGRGAA